MHVWRPKAVSFDYYHVSDCPHPYIYWKEAREPRWVLTDDGCVVEATKVDAITEVRGKGIRVRYRVHFHYGSRYTHGTSRYNFLDVLQNKSTRLSGCTWWEALTKAEPGLIRTFAMLVLAKQFDLKTYRYNRYQYSLLREISMKFFGTENRWRGLRTYFNHDKVREMIQEKIAKLLKEKNIDVEKVIGLLQSAETMALTQIDKMGNRGNPTAVLAVADRYAGLLGMNPNKQLGNSQKPHELLPGSEQAFDKILDTATGPIQEAVIVEDKNG